MKPGVLPELPAAPAAMGKGVPLKHLLGEYAVHCLAHNLRGAFPRFDARQFVAAVLPGLESRELMDRGHWIAERMRDALPARYADAIDVLLASLTPPLPSTSGNGLGVFFYLPHVSFVGRFGIDPVSAAEGEAFDVSMRAQYELTRRFSAEFSLRPFLVRHEQRTLARLHEWVDDPCPHVRRLCSEGTRPRLPWAIRLPRFVADPRPVLPILEALKDDSSLYVRRSVANHLGDIAKDHPALAFRIGKRWLEDATPERRWVVRHALRLPAKKGDPVALRLCTQAKARS